ncbi:hypothetical protein MTR67_048236 [Solanum verrucosum]|uniref:Integrase zinc-binding domain-containing protein n=1 Tax=Solanum verrucosum TaxID=315347 RepID=A0AAF0V185_SOLVR|nr:hypothetical protein MTR67_048236 [Solanum verrucosum]
MSVLHHPGKMSVVADALCRLSMESIDHVEDGKKELVRDVHGLDQLGVRLADFSEGGVIVHNGSKSSFVSDVKAKKDLDLVLVDLKTSRYSTYPGATNMYHNLWKVNWWNVIKKDIAEFMVKCLNCQQVKVEYQKPGGLAQDISIPTWKWKDLNMDFIAGLPHNRHQFDSIWVIMDRMMKSTHFLPIKISFSVEEYAKLYIQEMVRLHGVPLSIISNRGT